MHSSTFSKCNWWIWWCLALWSSKGLESECATNVSGQNAFWKPPLFQCDSTFFNNTSYGLDLTAALFVGIVGGRSLYRDDAQSLWSLSGFLCLFPKYVKASLRSTVRRKCSWAELGAFFFERKILYLLIDQAINRSIDRHLKNWFFCSIIDWLIDWLIIVWKMK